MPLPFGLQAQSPAWPHQLPQGAMRPQGTGDLQGILQGLAGDPQGQGGPGLGLLQAGMQGWTQPGGLLEYLKLLGQAPSGAAIGGVGAQPY